jgi:hypothetical protein
MKKESVRITPEHEKRYLELLLKDNSRSLAIDMVGKEFNLPNPHSRQTLKLWVEKWVKQGKLPSQFYTGRGGRPKKNMAHRPESSVLQRLPATPEEVVHLYTVLLNAAMKCPPLEEENNRLRNTLSAAEKRIRELEGKFKWQEETQQQIDSAQIQEENPGFIAFLKKELANQ